MASGFLRKSNYAPMAPERIGYFETIRKTRVPRYLFRAFTPESGGGDHLAINNETEIIPHGLMDGKKLDFYTFSEAELYALAHGHLHGRTSPLTQCTSWAASIHAVLCYAMYLSQKHYPVWVAVMDTHQVPDVLVFYVADLVGYADLEYQAYGHIHGHGYKAVELEHLIRHDLSILFPELDDQYVSYKQRLVKEAFGYELRKDMFHSSVPWKPVTTKEAEVAVAIGTLFGELAMPVVIALMCLRPRPWLKNPLVLNESDIDIHGLLDQVISPWTALSHTEPWLEPDVVNIGDFPYDCVDVKQCILLMKSFAKHLALLRLQQYTKKRKRMEFDRRDVVMEIDREERDWSKSLRPRPKKPRQD